MSQALVQLQSDDTKAEIDAAAMKTVDRLGRIARYEPPKVISFPIDTMRVAGPLSMAGNCY